MQPCLAVFDFGKKVADKDPIYGTYDFTFGTRVYANDEDTAPVSLPAQSFTMTFAAPKTDLAEVFEEQEPEASSEKVEYLYSSNKFVLNDVFGDSNDKLGWQRISGGYKLYLAAGAADRWYFNFELEMPTSYFT